MADERIEEEIQARLLMATLTETIEEEIQARLLMATLTEVGLADWLEENHPDDREGAKWMWRLARMIKWMRNKGYPEEAVDGPMQEFKLLHNALVKSESERIIKGKSCQKK